MNKIKYLSMTLMVVWSLLSCGGGGGGSDSTPIDDANNQFNSGNYAIALQAYVNLIASEGSPARVGAGWCQIRLKDITSAATYFSDAAADSLIDGYAGWSFVLWAQNNPQEAIDKADFVLTKSPSYIFSLDTDITADELIWIQAASYLQLEDYSSCYDKIKALDSSYTVNLSDPNIEDLLLQKLTSLGSASQI
ncbi:hypothetical protein K1X84_07195 [bacterium]|nr:hypothetical protein [bacterium]